MKGTMKGYAIAGVLGAVAIIAVGVVVFNDRAGAVPPVVHDLEASATELHWRSEGTLPDTWASEWHRTTIPQGESYKDAVLITRVGDGSARVAYVSGLPACVWEAPSLAHKVGGGRTLAEVGDHGWLKGGFGGNIYAVAGRTCEGFDIDLCDTVWC